MENLQEKTHVGKIEKKKGVIILLVTAALVAGLTGLFYWQITKNQIYIEKAEISAPEIALSSTGGGTLKAIFVKEGDVVLADTAVAQIDDETIRTAITGLVIHIENNIGENFLPNEPIVTIINPQELRVVARAEENKGLKDIAVGQQAVFSVDAFGSEKFYGIVDKISPTSRDSGVVFNISDKREVKEFDVKIKFDVKKYAQLKNGMSAKAWIYKK
jgi:multidrug resistance efflux pump